MKNKSKFILIIILYFMLLIKIRIKKVQIYDESTYFTTWGTSIYGSFSPPIELSHNSIRQIIQISAPGEKIRLKLSNKEGKTNLEIKSIIIADLISNSKININTMKRLTFSGKNRAIIGNGQEIYSDTINYPLRALSRISISIYFGSVPKKLSGHPLSLTYSYFEYGNKITKEQFSSKIKKVHWYFISALEISSQIPKKTIVFFGDSITDGVSKTHDARNNYPDIFFKKFYQNKNITNIGIINEGINGDQLAKKGIKRFEHDVLSIKGVSYIVLLYGINDIQISNISSTQLISTYKMIIRKAHKKNIFIYSGTLLPFRLFLEGKHWSEYKEMTRNIVNKWIRETKPNEGGFDSIFDFDKYLKDPKDETLYKKEYDCGDGIHPSLKGYQKMVDIIEDENLFTKNFKQ